MVMESLQRLDPPRRLGKLTLLARLGEGGMASVYVASIGDGALARLAAVKLLRAGAPDHDYRTRFEDEAKVVVRLHHNNIVDVREAGEVADQLYILMELIEGRDLADVWDRCAALGKAFPIPIAVYVVREILRGLHYAHTFPGLGLVHRDISPSNILMDWAGAVRLADFGLATSAMKASMTIPGVVFGKVGYMAPEQAIRGGLDGRADVYSCGVVLWELITGRPLRAPETDTQMVADWRSSRPSTLSKRVDTALDEIVERALYNERDKRWANAMEFMQALTQWLTERAPDTNQETVSAFMLQLFGEARERDHEAYTNLLELVPPASEEEESDEAGRDGGSPLAPPPSVTDLEKISSGTELADRYRVERTLGQGGMGTVYLAEHIGVGRQLAVKVLTHEWSRHETVARRFREEARAANAADHPNIVEVYDAGRLRDGRLYMAMEYLTGRSLYERISQDGPLSAVDACDVIGTVAAAIGAAHRVGIVHRDLKPDNVMLVPDGSGHRVKVLDFGISASAVRSAEEMRLTRPGHCVGTPEYMAPEQAKGHDATPRFDIYAIGVLLYEALSGKPPFQSSNMVEVLTRKATELPPPLEERVPGLPSELVELCHACLEVQPEDRPQSADDVAARLQALGARLGSGASLETGRVVVPPDTGPAGMPFLNPAVGGRPVRLVVTALATVLLGGILWWTVTTPQPESSEVADGSLAAQSLAGVDASHGSTSKVGAESGPAQPASGSAESASGSADSALSLAESASGSGPGVSSGASAQIQTGGSRDDQAEDASDFSVAEPRGAEELNSGSSAKTPEEPEPARASRPRRAGAASTQCKVVRNDAAVASARAEHKKAYRLAKNKPCWKGFARDRTHILVRAAFQMSKYSECVAAGEKSSDPRVKKTVAACRLKL